MLEEGTWADYREDVKKINRGLFDIIEQISPGDGYKLIKVKYPYGEGILDSGITRLPDSNGVFHKLTDKKTAANLREALGYCATPLALQLVNSGEVFLELGDRIVPLYLFVPGNMFGLFESATFLCGAPTTPVWNVTSGARSVVMVPKITDKIAHNRIRTELNIKNPKPEQLSDHWHIFKAITDEVAADNPWICEILFFTKPWLQDHGDNIGWMKFHKYLLSQSWLQSSHMRTRTELSLMWEKFAVAVGKRNLKPNSYIIDTIKNLMYLALGQNPAFRAADNNEQALPSRLIEDVYQNVYLLKEYAPTLLHTHMLRQDEVNVSTYYSLAYPTLLEGTPSIRHTTSIMSELREIKVLMDMLTRVLQDYDGGQYDLLKDTIFKYFHADKDRFGEISSAADAVLDDVIIRDSLEGRFKGKVFARNGQFFKGCIEIMHA